MMKQFSILTCCAIIGIAGCARSGSSSAERTQESEEPTTTAPQTTETPSSDQIAPPAPMEVPNIPDPGPSGWREYDQYFTQLLKVHKSIVDGQAPEAELKDLGDAAQKLADDQSEERGPSAPMRQMLSVQVRELEQRSRDNMPEEQRLETFRNLLQLTQEVAQTGVTEPLNGHVEKLESMKVALENRIMQVQFEHRK